MKEKDFSTLKIAKEATSFLDLHLGDSLAQSQALAPFTPSIYQLNPKIVRKFKRAYPPREKSDKIDAFVIADRHRFGRLTETYESHQPYLSLRRLTRYRFYLVKSLNRDKNYFLTHLYLKFSVFLIEKPFVSLFGATSLAEDTEFSPNKLLNLPLENFARFVVENSNNRFKDQ